MSKFLKNTVSTVALGLMGTVTAFAQNKSDAEIAPQLKAAPGVQVSVNHHEFNNNVLVATYTTDLNKNLQMKLVGIDENHNNILETNEIYDIEYKDILFNDYNNFTDYRAFGKVENGMVSKSENPVVVKDGKSKYTSQDFSPIPLSDDTFVTKMVPGLKKGLKP